MAIEKIQIEKFRGFKNVEFELGSNLTVIAGQNGTQKTTLLGMLTQPFAITDKMNPLYKEKPLCGGNYKSAFSEKFKLSSAFDKPKEHEWTLTYDGGKTFTVESIKPNDSRKNPVRFWQKGTRSKGSGYIPKPVIYLSLSRLFPLGEDSRIKDTIQPDLNLTPDEEVEYQNQHNKILLIPDVKMTKVSHLESKTKNTLGANTSYYDWKMNSAGQDDVGKIILALLSFKRLKDKYKTKYLGGILAIDELDATLYPASQEKLIDVLRTYASKCNIQVIFTTHSLTMLERVSNIIEKQKMADDIRLIYLEKRNQSINCLTGISYSDIHDKLLVLARKESDEKIMTFSEDDETRCWMKVLLGPQRTKKLNIVDCTIGCKSLMDLTRMKIPPFVYPNSIVVLDGDAQGDVEKQRKILKNYLLLPGSISPERLLAQYLNNLEDDNEFWKSCGKTYTKQFLFKEFSLDEINKDRDKAKKWFKSQLPFWGRNGSKAINAWCKANPDAKTDFITKFEEMVKKFGL